MGPTRLVSSSNTTSRMAFVNSADSTCRGVLSSRTVKSSAFRPVTGLPDFGSTTVTSIFVDACNTGTSARANIPMAQHALFIGHKQSSAICAGGSGSIRELAAQDGDRLPAEKHAVAL